MAEAVKRHILEDSQLLDSIVDTVSQNISTAMSHSTDLRAVHGQTLGAQSNDHAQAGSEIIMGLRVRANVVQFRLDNTLKFYKEGKLTTYQYQKISAIVPSTISADLISPPTPTRDENSTEVFQNISPPSTPFTH